jgi:hypothetical protein
MSAWSGALVAAVAHVVAEQNERYPSTNSRIEKRTTPGPPALPLIVTAGAISSIHAHHPDTLLLRDIRSHDNQEAGPISNDLRLRGSQRLINLFW